MNLLYIHQYFTTRDGAGGTRSYEFARHLAGRGHRVTMLTGSAALGHVPELSGDGLVRRASIDGIDVIAVRLRYSNRMGYLRRAAAFIKFMLVSSWVSMRLKDVDVVYASSTPVSVGVVGRVAALWHGAPFVFELRDLWPEYIEDFGLSRSRLIMGTMRLVCRHLYRKACSIVVISDSMNRRVQSLYPQARGKVVTIPLGADTDAYPEPGYAAGEYAGDGGDFVVAYCGTLGYVNGVEGLLPVAEKLKGKGVSFVIAGDGKMMPHIEAMKAEKGLDNVVLLGEVSKRRVFELIRKSGACVITHRCMDENGRVYINCLDSLSNKFFDYIAAGRPVLVNHECESAKYIEEHGCGIRLPFGDHDLAASEILRLKENPELCMRMGENARLLARDVFDRKKMALKWEGVLVQAVGQAGTA